MRELYTYQPPGQLGTVLMFLHQLEPKLREKLLWQFFRLLALSFGGLMLYYRKEAKCRETAYAVDAEIDTEQEETP